jgi:tetratricopeptide (TPR) repeat protein
MPYQPVNDDLQRAIDAIYADRDRSSMQPTIDAFEGLLARDPEHPVLLYEVGGAYDTAGQEALAVGYYERALAAGLDGDVLRRCLVQYGSTLRNLDRFDESVAVLERARDRFPESPAVRVLLALSLHAAGRSDAAVAELLRVIADEVRVPDIARYEAALRGNAEYLAGLDR